MSSARQTSSPPDRQRHSQGLWWAFGLNADTGEYGDLIKDGVIDPTKVVHCALANASSVARILLSTDVCIADKPSDSDGDEGPGGGMDDMGMM